MGAMVWRGVAAGWLALAATACAFDPNTIGGTAGVGSTSGDGTTSGITITSTSAGPATSSETTDAPTATSTMPDTTGEPESEADTGSATTEVVVGTEGSSTGSGTTTDSCEESALFAQLLWVKDLPNQAITDMELVESTSIELDGEPVIYARSLTTDVGSVTFEFETDCEGELYLWGFVFDWVPSSTNGPDSYWYGLDVDAMASGDAWVYGCTTSASGWSWQPLRHYNGSPCDTDPLVPTLEGGAHTFMLLNREPGTTGFEIYDFAAVAAIAISNDSAYDPYSDYTP